MKNHSKEKRGVRSQSEKPSGQPFFSSQPVVRMGKKGYTEQVISTIDTNDKSDELKITANPIENLNFSDVNTDIDSLIKVEIMTRKKAETYSSFSPGVVPYLKKQADELREYYETIFKDKEDIIKKIRKFNFWIKFPQLFYDSYHRLGKIQRSLGFNNEQMDKKLIEEIDNVYSIGKDIPKHHFRPINSYQPSDGDLGKSLNDLGGKANDLSDAYDKYRVEILNIQQSDLTKKNRNLVTKLEEIDKNISTIVKMGKYFSAGLKAHKIVSTESYLKEADKLSNIGNLTGELANRHYAPKINEIKSKQQEIEGKINVISKYVQNEVFQSSERDFKSKLDDYFKELIRIEDIFSERREDYLEYGQSLDYYAISSSSRRKEGKAPQRGGERYPIYMTVYAQLNETNMIADKVFDNFPWNVEKKAWNDEKEKKEKEAAAYDEKYHLEHPKEYYEKLGFKLTGKMHEKTNEETYKKTNEADSVEWWYNTIRVHRNLTSKDDSRGKKPYSIIDTAILDEKSGISLYKIKLTAAEESAINLMHKEVLKLNLNVNKFKRKNAKLIATMEGKFKPRK